MVGCMSGTSLDGLDLALCDFFYQNHQWSYQLNRAETIAYPEEWLVALRSAPQATSTELLRLHRAYGTYCGERAQHFMGAQFNSVDAISTHGHTVFHDPASQFNFQLGCGLAMSLSSGKTVIGDFRTLDILMHGQGAPLVPVGDRYLFKEYRACVNLGGFSNWSFADADGVQKAWDICPVNIILNEWAQKKGLPFDRDGMLAASGTVDSELLNVLEALPFYELQGPKSLGKEWIDSELEPAIHPFRHLAPETILRTLCEHMALRMAKSFELIPPGKILFTGGGARNNFLIDRIRHHCIHPIELPSAETIDFKEAVVFAFLGVLKLNGVHNVWSSVTGSARDSCSGIVFESPYKKD